MSHIDVYDEEQDADNVHLHVETWNMWDETNEQGETKAGKNLHVEGGLHVQTWTSNGKRDV